MKKICVFLNGPLEITPFKIKVNDTIISSLSFEVPLPLDVPLFVADGGLNHLLTLKAQLSNLTWVGDADSLCAQALQFLENSSIPNKRIIKLNPKKDLSDLAATLDLVAQEYSHTPLLLEIFGGLGGRRDHEFSNLEEVKRIRFSQTGFVWV